MNIFDYQQEDILLCINCDAEYTITRMDDEEEADSPQFCPFCGYQHDEGDDDDDEEFEDD